MPPPPRSESECEAVTRDKLAPTDQLTACVFGSWYRPSAWVMTDPLIRPSESSYGSPVLPADPTRRGHLDSAVERMGGQSRSARLPGDASWYCDNLTRKHGRLRVVPLMINYGIINRHEILTQPIQVLRYIVRVNSRGSSLLYPSAFTFIRPANRRPTTVLRLLTQLAFGSHSTLTLAIK